MCGEELRELGGVAQLLGCNLREDEAIVPFTAGLLQGFELRGEAVGCNGGTGGGLGKIARELGAFADFVQFGGGERSLGGRMGLAVPAVPTPDQCDQVSFAEGERPRGGQCIQQVCEDVREFVSLLV